MLNFYEQTNKNIVKSSSQIGQIGLVPMPKQFVILKLSNKCAIETNCQSLSLTR